jgi:hypothetical protein
MMRRILYLLVMLLCSASYAYANDNAQGWCEQGATLVITSGLTSTTNVQGSFPACTISVYVHGGSLATIYSDNNNTPLANPFSAQTNGQWSFYSASGRFDITMSGGGLSSPVTYSDVVLYDPAQDSTTQCVLSPSTTPAFNAQVCSIFSMTLTAAAAASISGGVPGQSIMVSLTQGGGGPWAFTWPTSFYNPPSVTQVAGASAQFRFTLLADGLWHHAGTGESQVFNTAQNGNQLFINGNPVTNTSGTGGTLIEQLSASLTTPSIAGGALSATFSGNPIFSGNFTLGQLDTIVYVDGTRYTTVASAISALPSTGGKVIIPAGTWPIGSTITLAVASGPIVIEGSGTGTTTTGGTRLVASSGSVTPMIAVQGTSASVRAGNIYFRDLTIQGVYTASQQCVTVDHSTVVDFRDVQFIQCGQAEWIDDAYQVGHHHVNYFQSGSGGTNTTATVRVENTSNPGVPSEQIYWDDHSVWEGASGMQGTAVYFGPATNQERISGSKIDYNGSAANFCLISIVSASIVSINDNTISDSNITSPANGTVCVGGTSGTHSDQVSIVNNPVISLNNTIPAVWLDYTTNYIVSNNGFGGLGAGLGTAISVTANAFGGNILGNRMNTVDALLTDASGLSVALNSESGSEGTQWDLRTTLNTNQPIVSTSTLSTTGGLTDTSAATKAKRPYYNQGTALSSGNVALSSSPSWGTSPSFTVAGFDPAFAVAVNSGSGTPGANPTVTVTFADGAWADGNPVCMVSRADGTSPSTAYWEVVSTTTQAIILFVGTPATSSTYTVNVTCTGR